MSAKDTVIEMVKQMPDDATVEEIIRRLSVRQQINEGLAELDTGLGIEYEEMERRHAGRLD
jgi:hypothetical protein